MTQDDILDAGGEIIPDSLDLLDSNNRIIPTINNNCQSNFCGIHKATIPISRLRELVELDNKDNLVQYKCDTCMKCETCKISPKTRAISIQESREQESIENSVTLDLENRKVSVTYPWSKNPVEFLSKKHRTNNNYRQAKNVYDSQCKKAEVLKEGMRKTHAELVSKGFMTRLSEIPQDEQDYIVNADFNHYLPWTIVAKEDSLSTPIRMVVDPTQTGMNVILPKGENRIG